MRRAASESHPDRSKLLDFALGKLPRVDMDRIEAHLAGCAGCGRTVASAPDDELVGLLRRTSPGPAGPTRLASR